MDLFRPANPRSRGAGHYRRPGTSASYCGRTVEAQPVTEADVTGVCQQCAKGEKRDRVAAEQVVADRDVNAPTLAQRAGVRYALVGTGRRVHYSNNDDTLCGREVTEYTDGLDDRRPELCARCITAAEHRAYARALAADSPLAAAAVDLAETVEQADADQAPAEESAKVPGALVDPWTWIRRPSSSDAARAAEERAERRQQLADSRGANAYPLAVDAVRRFVREMPKAGALRIRVVEGSPEATLTRDDLHALAYSGHTTADAVARVREAVAAHVRHGEREVHVMFPALGMRPALYLPDVMALLTYWEHGQAAAEQAEADQFTRAAHAADAVEHAEQVEAGVATVAEAVALYDSYIATAEAAVEPVRCTLHGDQCDHDPRTPHHFADLHIGPPVARTAPTICPEFVTLDPDDLIADEWRTAAALVTEAEATEGTWRGAWIGEQPADDVLFVVDGTAEQGALFTPEATAPAPTVREQQRAALDRIRAKADADRAADRAETDDQIAAECAAHGVPAPRTVAARIAARTEQAPARRVIEGVVVSHGGTTQGSKPSDATNPDVIAAREALAGLAVATLTDHHDVTEPTEDECDTRGYFVDPRTHGRVAVYWLEAGRIVRRDQMPHGPALDCLADRLKRRGWAVEKMLRSSQCVFAHRPSTD